MHLCPDEIMALWTAWRFSSASHWCKSVFARFVVWTFSKAVGSKRFVVKVDT